MQHSKSGSISLTGLPDTISTAHVDLRHLGNENRTHRWMDVKCDDIMPPTDGDWGIKTHLCKRTLQIRFLACSQPPIVLSKMTVTAIHLILQTLS